MDTRVKDLNLLLLFLTGWEEDSTREPGKKIYRSWKGYLFEILNELENDKLIHQIKNGKSVILTEQGRRTAQQLKERLLEGKQPERSAANAPRRQEPSHAGEW